MKYQKFFKLSKFKKFLYRRIYFPRVYKLHKDLYETDLFWNIISWYEFFKRKFGEQYKVSFEFILVDDCIGRLIVYNKTETVLKIKFPNKVLNFIRDENLNIYCQCYGYVYELKSDDDE